MKNMKKARSLFILLLPLVFGLIAVPITLGDAEAMTSQASGVSNYQITQSVTYQVEIDYQLTHTADVSSNYWYKVARLNDRGPDNPNTQYTPEYQVSELKSSSIVGVSDTGKSIGEIDAHGNVFDIFEAELSKGDVISIDYVYEVKVNEIVFDDTITDDEIGQYDKSSNIFDLYNGPEPYYETTNPSLISFSNSLKEEGDNVVEIAEDVYAGVVEHLDYVIQGPERGALWAYNNEQGDCSEYSNLMITLLRIQDIPARKVTGILYNNTAGYKPAIGESITFDQSYDIVNDQQTITNNREFLGHAWMEYYVPQIGWISSDPTFGEELDYFNRQDYLRFALTVGANIPDAVGDVRSEYPFLPLPRVTVGAEFESDCEYEITVLETNLQANSGGGSSLSELLKSIPSFDVMAVLLISMASATVIILLTKRNIKS